MERSKQNKHVVSEKDNDVDDGVDNGDDDSDEDSVDGADNHLTHLSKAADCYLTEKEKQNNHVVCDKDNDVDDDGDDSVDNNVDNGVDDSVDDGVGNGDYD
eukprot:15349485-Ditylum_brightwellii.AAC.1